MLVHAFARGMLRVAGAGAGAGGQHAAVPVRIDLNRATVGELMALPGIGRVRAAAIVLHRVRYGPFRSVDELTGIDGIGAETLAALRSHACVGPAGGR